MAMKCVNSNRHPAEDRCNATQYASLRRVSVEYVWPVLPDFPADCYQSPKVTAETNRPSQGLNPSRWQAGISKFDEIGFGITHVTTYQTCLKRLISQPSGQDAGLPRWSTNVHPGQDSQDPDRRVRKALCH